MFVFEDQSVYKKRNSLLIKKRFFFILKKLVMHLITIGRQTCTTTDANPTLPK